MTDIELLAQVYGATNRAIKLEEKVDKLFIALLDEKKDYIEMLEQILDNIREECKDRSVLEMFAYQGPPSKRWIETEGQYWKGYNAKAEKIRKILDGHKISRLTLVDEQTKGA